MQKIKEGAKSLLTLLSGIIVSVLAFGVDEPLARYVALAGVIIGAIIVWLTPNAETDEQQRVRLAGEDALLKQQDMENQSYEELGGQDFPTEQDPDAEFPNSETLYQPGEVEGERFGEVDPDDLPEAKPFDAGVVSGNDER